MSACYNFSIKILETWTLHIRTIILYKKSVLLKMTQEFSKENLKLIHLIIINLANMSYIIDCTGRRMELNRYMKDVTCTPRPTHVKLIPERGYTLYPDYAMVNRCGGFCPNSKSCLPVKTSNKTIIVTRESYNSSQCYEVSVKEHVKCK